MAKPVQPNNLKPSMPAGEAAGKLLDAKVEEVLSFAEPALAGEVEGIHDMRVAVKRLRETLRLFRRLMPPRRLEKVLPLVEDLNDALGLVRDQDVLQENAAWLAGQTKRAALALAGAGELWAQERQRRFNSLVEHWSRLTRREKLPQQLLALAKATRKERKKLDRMPFDRFAYLSIIARSQRVQEPLAQARQTDNPTTLHRLRLAIKRLKYTMEPFLTVLPTLQEPYATVAGVQETLGLARDFDLLESALIEHLSRDDQMDSIPAKSALRILGKHRGYLYKAAHKEVESFADDSWRRRLHDALD